MSNRIKEYFVRIKGLNFFAGIIFGTFLGIALVLLLQSTGTFLSGVLLGVILEQLFLGGKKFYLEWRDTDPLRKLLGPIASDEECYIFFSAFERDLNRADEFKLTRPHTSREEGDTLIAGQKYVIGESDALALSLIQSLLARLPKKRGQIKVHREEEGKNNWGVNFFCIGAHNSITRVILEKFKNPFFVFDYNYKVITRPDIQAEDNEHTQTLIRKGVYIKSRGDTEPTDYGVILKFRDQFSDDNKVIFVIAGIGPAGTSGAAYYLLSHYKELAPLGEEFGVLIQVPSGYQSARRVDFDKEAQFYEPLKG